MNNHINLKHEGYDDLYFTTKDLLLAATLLVNGLPLRDVDRTNPKQSFFVFDRSKELEAIVERFWARRERIEPLALGEQLRYLKSLIYQ